MKLQDATSKCGYVKMLPVSPNGILVTSCLQKKRGQGYVNAVKSSRSRKQTKTQRHVGWENSVVNAYEIRASSAPATPWCECTKVADYIPLCRIVCVYHTHHCHPDPAQLHDRIIDARATTLKRLPRRALISTALYAIQRPWIAQTAAYSDHSEVYQSA